MEKKFWKISFIFLIVIALSCINHISSSEPLLTLHSQGFGPVVIGMTPAAASSAPGIPIRPTGELDEDEIYCHYEYPEGSKGGVGFMVEEGIITRVGVFNDTWQTDSGIRTGQEENNIYKNFQGKITEKIHPYIGRMGKYIIVDPTKGYRMIFETDDGVITGFRVGMHPSVDYIEGCL